LDVPYTCGKGSQRRCWRSHGRKQNDPETDLLGDNSNRFDKISIVRKDSGGIELSLKGVSNQVSTKIDVGSLFFSFPHAGNDWTGPNEFEPMMRTEFERLRQSSPNFSS
jgi:hypothetical protein